MKKVFSIMLALALVLSLSIVATPALADVHGVSVEVGPNTVGLEAKYTIVFNITKTLALGQTVSVEFPSGTTVPAASEYEYGDVKVQDTSISPGDINVSTRVVTITLPEGIGAPGAVTVVFEAEAGVKNPANPGDYTLRARTSQEPNWVASAPYTILLSAKSTYEFAYQVPEMIWREHPVEVDITLQTKALGLEGYETVLIEFWKEGPGNVLFQGWDDDLGVWHDFNDHGYWGPPDGFPIGEDYQATTPFKLTFDTVGLYNIVLVLWEVVDAGDPETWVELVRDDATVAVAGVSVDVSLSKGWNLMSLPIIPDDSAIASVLADVMDDVISVWFHDPSAGWRSFAPGVPSNLATMKDGNAYWVHMKQDATLTVVGVAIVLPGHMPPSYNVVQGWNMIGFKSMTNMPASDYLDGTEVVRIYKFVAGAWEVVQPGNDLEHGLGYWVAFSKAGTIYP